MIHQSLGDTGHLLIIISFVTSLVAAFAYFKATINKEIGQDSWIKFARISFIIHGFAVIGVVSVLFAIIYNNYFEYHYAWSHSSVNLATHYMIACFWEGQEGSFMVWALWQALLGFVIIKTNKKWEAPVMTVFATVQAFLASMILTSLAGVFSFSWAFTNNVVPKARVKLNKHEFLIESIGRTLVNGN